MIVVNMTNLSFCQAFIRQNKKNLNRISPVQVFKRLEKQETIKLYL